MTSKYEENLESQTFFYHLCLPVFQSNIRQVFIDGTPCLDVSHAHRKEETELSCVSPPVTAATAASILSAALDGNVSSPSYSYGEWASTIEVANGRMPGLTHGVGYLSYQVRRGTILRHEYTCDAVVSQDEYYVFGARYPTLVVHARTPCYSCFAQPNELLFNVFQTKCLMARSKQFSGVKRVTTPFKYAGSAYPNPLSCRRFCLHRYQYAWKSDACVRGSGRVSATTATC